MASPSLSTRTALVSVAGLGIAGSLYVMIQSGVGGDSSVTLLRNLLEVLPVGMAAIVAVWCAMQFGRGEAVRRQWSLIAAAVVIYELGLVAWMYYEVIRGVEVPFPGLPDVFFSLMLPVMFAGLFLAVRSFRGLFDPWRAYLVSTALGVALAAVLCLTVLRPGLVDSSTGLLARMLAALYPVGDLVLLLPPALTLAYLTSRLGGGSLAWPWRAVVVGLLLIVFADTMFAIQSAAGTYVTGNFVDLGWSLGYVSIAAGASIAVDVLVTAPRTSAARLAAVGGEA